MSLWIDGAIVPQEDSEERRKNGYGSSSIRIGDADDRESAEESSNEEVAGRRRGGRILCEERSEQELSAEFQGS